MVEEFIKSFLLIFMAEMGDKTQILAMAFATQFKIKEVLVGVFIGSLLNHGMAVALGACISTIIPIKTIQIVAGFLFIGFALWTLMEEEDEQKHKRRKLGPVLTVAIAFFIGELGDKTQLAAITLASTAHFPMIILMGTVSGMVFTSTLGIFVGSKIGNRVPALAMKIISSAVFMLCGITKLYTTLPKEYISNLNVILFFIIMAIIICIILRPILKPRKGRAVRASSMNKKQRKVDLKSSRKRLKSHTETKATFIKKI